MRNCPSARLCKSQPTDCREFLVRAKICSLPHRRLLLLLRTPFSLLTPRSQQERKPRLHLCSRRRRQRLRRSRTPLPGCETGAPDRCVLVDKWGSIHDAPARKIFTRWLIRNPQLNVPVKLSVARFATEAFSLESGRSVNARKAPTLSRMIFERSFPPSTRRLNAASSTATLQTVERRNWPAVPLRENSPLNSGE